MYSSWLPASVIGEIVHRPSCFRFLQRNFVGGEAIVSWQWPQFSGMATVAKARDQWLQTIWKLPSLQFMKVPWESIPITENEGEKIFSALCAEWSVLHTSLLLPSAASLLWSISCPTSGELPMALKCVHSVKHNLEYCTCHKLAASIGADILVCM